MEIINGKKGKHKNRSIFRLFLEDLCALLIAIIVLIAASFAGFFLCMQNGIILQADYAEDLLNREESNLKKGFDSSLLPSYSSYILMDDQGNLLDTNMSRKEIEKTRQYFSEGKKEYYSFYKFIFQDDGNQLIVKYEMLAHFRNPILGKMIPYPEIEIILLILLLIILFAVITAMKFSKKLKVNLIPINTATDKIKAQDLDFSIESTEITEFNASLSAIAQLKEALKESLELQWSSEQKKKSQLCALAHDIKTPLTVISGNTELLLENETEQEKKELLTYIHAGANTIEKYLELLMTVVNEETLSAAIAKRELEEFVQEVVSEIIPLCKIKNISFLIQNDVKSNDIYVDAELLKRALINMADNAVRYSAENSTVKLAIEELGEYIEFTMLDEGKGFSQESLHHAADEFYTDEAARTDHHYGLGLNFAKRVARIHKGTLKFENRTDRSGAKVCVSVKNKAV